MNILRSSVFRSICRVETMILILMLMMPVVIVFMLIGSYNILHFLLPSAAIFTTLRMLMVISLANHLAEASAVSQYFNESKNWFLMQCVIESVALMLNVSMIVLKNTFMRIPHTRYFLMIGGYLVYLVAQQLFTCFAKERLLRGFCAVWYFCGDDPVQGKGVRVTFLLQIMSSILYAALVAFITLFPSLTMIAYGLVGAAVFILLLVQFRITMHARKTAPLLAALSE